MVDGFKSDRRAKEGRRDGQWLKACVLVAEAMTGVPGILGFSIAIVV